MTRTVKDPDSNIENDPDFIAATSNGNVDPTKQVSMHELQKKLKDIFGLDLVFHQKDGQKPFGYSIIDHKSGKVFKGSEVLKMNELFEDFDLNPFSWIPECGYFIYPDNE